jgi:hypothetical protein
VTEVDDSAESVALALSRRWWDDIWRDANLDAVDEVFTDPFVRHYGAGTVVTPRREYKAMLKEFQRTLGRPQTRIDDRTVDGDKVWTRATSRGINRETGEPALLTWLLLQRVADGRIAEQWVLTLFGIDWNV